jgi:very-short-patch-repair endonuclease
MWFLLRDRRLDGVKFRRQVPIGRFVADFACFEALLVVELDGSQHIDRASDKVRDDELARRGFEVLRFWNNDIFLHGDDVLRVVVAAAQRRTGDDRAV